LCASALKRSQRSEVSNSWIASPVLALDRDHARLKRGIALGAGIATTAASAIAAGGPRCRGKHADGQSIEPTFHGIAPVSRHSAASALQT
jgi:hypothetical protein